MAIPLPQFLAEFRPAAAASLHPGTQALEPVQVSLAGADLHAHQIADAYARGHQDGVELARSEWAENLASERARAEACLVEQRSRWVAEEGHRLAELLTTAIGDLEASIAASIVSVLRPFLSAELRQRAVASLCESIRTLLAHNPDARLRITGPGDLLDQMRLRLGAVAMAVDYEPADTVDVRVCSGRTVIETEIAAWMARLQLGPARSDDGE